jgi:hypothetical protein
MNVAAGPELQSWIKGFLPEVRVEKPRALREAIARDVKQAALSL